MKHLKSLSIFFAVLAMTGLALNTQNVEAAEHSGGAGGSYIKIQPLTVNLVEAEKYLQMSFSIKGGTPEVAANVSTYMPIVRHELILLLSSQKSEEILTVNGKIKLMEALKNAVNKAIGMSGHGGVSEVVLESFIVQ
jgi:flagellar FliL protein